VLLYLVQRFSAYKYGKEFLNSIAFENFFRLGGRLIDFQKQESLLKERRVALVIILNEVTYPVCKESSRFSHSFTTAPNERGNF